MKKSVKIIQLKEMAEVQAKIAARWECEVQWHEKNVLRVEDQIKEDKARLANLKGEYSASKERRDYYLRNCEIIDEMLELLTKENKKGNHGRKRK